MTLKRRVLLIGATGFTGQRLYARLKDVADVVCLVRRDADISVLGAQAQCIVGDLVDTQSLQKACAGVTDVICTASLGFGHAEELVRVLEEAHIERAVFVSTTGLFTRLNPESKAVRKQAERLIQQSALNWTILRPTMIYGRKGDRNMERVVRLVKRWPVVCIPGSGRALQQPVHVDDVAGAIVSAWGKKVAERRIYTISGAAPLTFRDVLKQTADALNKRIFVLSVPVWLTVFVLRLYEGVVYTPKIKVEQVLRLQEDKVFPHTEASQDLDFKPRAFQDGVRVLIKELES